MGYYIGINTGDLEDTVEDYIIKNSLKPLLQLPIENLEAALPRKNKISKKINVLKTLEKLQTDYSSRGINLVCISNKWSFRTSEKFAAMELFNNQFISMHEYTNSKPM